MTRPRVLLVNPPIYDFTAYDFWLRPYGLLRVAGQLRGKAGLFLFDYLDRRHPTLGSPADDRWGRGPFRAEDVAVPSALASLPRRYRRFGLPRRLLAEYIAAHGPFDAVLVQTVMTYWYPGVQEVIEDLRRWAPGAAIALGGVYATLCPDHAVGLGADLVVRGGDLQPLWELLGIEGNADELPFWEGYPDLDTGVVKLTEGCPFRCTYCSVPAVYPRFSGHVERALQEWAQLRRLGARRIAFYDDALLFKTKDLLLPFLREVVRQGADVELHTPNALNARFIDAETAVWMVRAGFRSFHLGFESDAYVWQKKTGGKVYSAELVQAVGHLEAAGIRRGDITAYLIIAHPQGVQQDVERSMQMAHELGIRVTLSEFSPIPGTPDGEACREWVDLDEPLWHNKTAFPLVFLGAEEVQRLKDLGRRLNGLLGRGGARAVG